MKGYCNMTELALFGFVVLFVGQMSVLGANSANRNSLLMSGPWALNSWSDADPNFLRFGRSAASNEEGIKRAAGQSANFLRFGRSAPYDPNFLRFGRQLGNQQQHNKGLVDQSYLRFGRSSGGNKGNNFLRFGRGAEDIPSEAEAFEREYRQSNNPNFLRFG
uniref:Uncharacterized protein n=1 Tax=Meloidogyne enterolobii TaxID=390850 RepID=A0A6V7X4F0_MELEN|nr:unnamed protein product [Meloidogyne enterolobii]